MSIKEAEREARTGAVGERNYLKGGSRKIALRNAHQRPKQAVHDQGKEVKW